MKISKIKIFALIVFLAMVFLNINFHYVAAENLKDAFKVGETSPLGAAAGKGAGFNTAVSFETIAGAIITSALCLMGVLFLIVAIYGGYTWMMARGNEQEVEKAKNIIIYAVIGLVVILAGYAITGLVYNIWFQSITTQGE